MNKRNESPFWSGFLKGLAPLDLFADIEAPTFQPPQFTPLYRPASSAIEALRGDIRRIGKDFDRVIARLNDEK
jgi:hypothetical protein